MHIWRSLAGVTAASRSSRPADGVARSARAFRVAALLLAGFLPTSARAVPAPLEFLGTASQPFPAPPHAVTVAADIATAPAALIA